MAARLFVSLVEITLTEGEMVVRENLMHESWRRRSAGRVKEPMVRGPDNEAAKVVQTCCSFAEAIDWRFCVPYSLTERVTSDGALSILLSENEAALHVGSFIDLTVMPAKDTVELRGGCFNMFYQPATVYEEFLPLSGLNPRRLEKALEDMQHRLDKYYRNYVRT